MTERQKVTQVHDIRSDLDCVNMSDAIAFLERMIKEHGDQVLDIGTIEEYGYATAFIQFYTERDETDVEMERRLYNEKVQRDSRRRTFESLKKEFGE